jgi:hypothetical protein
MNGVCVQALEIARIYIVREQYKDTERMAGMVGKILLREELDRLDPKNKNEILKQVCGLVRDYQQCKTVSAQLLFIHDLEIRLSSESL